MSVHLSYLCVHFLHTETVCAFQPCFNINIQTCHIHSWDGTKMSDSCFTENFFLHENDHRVNDKQTFSDNSY